MLSIKEHKSEKLEKGLSDQLKNDLGIPAEEEIINEDELFVLADYDASAGEKGG